MGEDIRKRKDEAAALVTKGHLEQALVAYQNICALEPKDLTMALKVADLHRKLKHTDVAIGHYMAISEQYAADGQLLKAIAACKLILDLSPTHTQTQAMLAGLYAKKTGRAATANNEPSVHVASETAEAPPPSPGTSLGQTDGLPMIPLLSDLPKNAFILLMEQMRMRQFSHDEVILQEGDQADAMYIISSGRVKVTRQAESGATVVLAHLSDGAFFGEMALLAETPRSASVIAEDETMLFEISRDVLEQVIGNFPSVAHTMQRFYRQRLLANVMNTSTLFRTLENQDRCMLIEKFKSKELAANEKILEEGDKGDGLYVVLTGRIEVSKKVSGQKKILAQLKEGDVFGELSVLTEDPIAAQVRTLRKSIVLKLPKKVFVDVIASYPQLRQKLETIAQERQQTTAAILAGKMEFGEEGLSVV